MSISIVRLALVTSVTCTPPRSAGEVPDQPGLHRAEERPRRVRARAAGPGTWSSSQRSRGPGEVRGRRQPADVPERARRAGRGCSSATRSSVRVSCQMIAGATGRPVRRSQTTVVSRWLAMPTAATSSGGGPRAPAPPAAPAGRCARSPRRRARPSRAAGSAAGAPAGRPRPAGRAWSNTMQRVEVVPWSMATTYALGHGVTAGPGGRPRSPGAAASSVLEQLGSRGAPDGPSTRSRAADHGQGADRRCRPGR